MLDWTESMVAGQLAPQKTAYSPIHTFTVGCMGYFLVLHIVFWCVKLYTALEAFYCYFLAGPIHRQQRGHTNENYCKPHAQKSLNRLKITVSIDGTHEKCSVASFQYRWSPEVSFFTVLADSFTSYPPYQKTMYLPFYAPIRQNKSKFYSNKTVYFCSPPKFDFTACLVGKFNISYRKLWSSSIFRTEYSF